MIPGWAKSGFSRVAGVLEAAGRVLAMAAIMLSAGLGPVGGATERAIALDVQALRQAQPRLMAEQTDGLRPGVEGEVELFAVLAAWYPNQRVFLREVESVGRILAARYGAGGRVVRLANSVEQPLRFPLATPMNLAAAISAVRAKMNAGEDVLLVYLTSHGGRGFLVAGDWAAETPTLWSEQLARILDRAAVPNVVAVIGACHSGSFVPSLAGPDRLVVTAAAADRTSFGCSDTNRWTYFGRAFFDRALRETRSLTRAFERAAALVGEWEAAEGFPSSDPQIAEGEAIAPVLEALARHAGD